MIKRAASVENDEGERLPKSNSLATGTIAT